MVGALVRAFVGVLVGRTNAMACIVNTVLGMLVLGYTMMFAYVCMLDTRVGRVTAVVCRLGVGVLYSGMHDMQIVQTVEGEHSVSRLRVC